MIRFCIRIWFIFFSIASYAQVEMTGDFLEFIKGKVSSLPGAGTNVFVSPDDDELAAWESAIESLLDDDINEAIAQAALVEYDIVEFTDDSDTELHRYYILIKKTESNNHWGIYVFNPDACRSEMVLQAPHPKYDLSTGDQAAYLFKELDAFSLFISGTHRCNSTVDSDCSGTTTACSSTGPFRISDAAHHVTSLFQKTTALLNTNYPTSVFIQLHGFGKQSDDPSVIMSNGTRITPTKDYINLIFEGMEAEDPTLTAKIGHVDFDWDRLLAFTNTQGRLINGSVDPCQASATSTLGRFIHLEQEFDKLRSGPEKWEVMLSGLTHAFPCGIVTQSFPEETLYTYSIYPNPFTQTLTIKSADQRPGTFTLYNGLGAVISTQPMQSELVLDVTHRTEGIYFYTIAGQQSLLAKGKLQKINQH